MGDLVDDEGAAVVEDYDKVALLRGKLFGDSQPQEIEYTCEEGTGWKNADTTLRRLLSTTNNKSTPGPDGVT